MKLKSKFLFILLPALFYFPLALAAEEKNQPLGISGLVGSFYAWSLGIGGLVALGVIVYGGILYTVSAGNASRQDDAKQWLTAALIGLLLLFGSFLILNTINPSLVILQDIKLKINKKTGEISHTVVDNATGLSTNIDFSGDVGRAKVKELVAGGVVSFTPHSDHPTDPDNDLHAVDSGIAVRMDGEKVPIDPKVWGVLAYLGDAGFKIRVSSMVGTHPRCPDNHPSCNSPSRHWDGHAVDIDMINGQLVNGVDSPSAKAETIALMQKLLELYEICNKNPGSDACSLVPSQVIANGNSTDKYFRDPEVMQYQINGSVPSGQEITTDHTNHVHIGY